MGHFEDYLHSAALKIQKRYRGWKGRKDFSRICNRIVKVQAHVRGHQVRKQYKIVVWSDGLLIILAYSEQTGDGGSSQPQPVE
ncbi:hypothetical protein HN51_055374 [Arachis hypogaea]